MPIFAAAKEMQNLKAKSLSFLIAFGMLVFCTTSGFTNSNVLDNYCFEEECSSSIALPPGGAVSLAWATYHGKAINNVFNDVALDASGNIYAFGSSIKQGFDALLVKFSPTGQLLWETHLGGSDSENFNPSDNYDYGKISLDAAGNIYVTGITQSNDFPTSSAFQGSRGGGIDAFVSKLDNDGNILLSSYLGGAGDEQIGGAGGIAIDANGYIYVGGSTSANGFFNTTGAFQNSHSGGVETDAFVVRIAPDFSSITGTYWGDEEQDLIRDLAVANDGTLWAVGTSFDSGLTLPGQQGTVSGDYEGLVLAFSNDLRQINTGTFIGGRFDDQVNSLVVDGNGDVYVCGITYSTNDFPTLNAFQSAYTGGSEAFITKLNGTGQLVWSSFLGGGQNENALSISLDSNQDVYISGTTSSDDLPILGTIQETYNTLNCESDAFIFKFGSDGTRAWGSYYGGWRQDFPNGIAINSNGQIIAVGKTESTDLPISENAHQSESIANGINAFISTFEIACPSVPIIIHSIENAIYYDKFWCNRYETDSREFFSEDSCALQLIAPPGYTDYSWFKNGSLIRDANSQYHTIRNPGSRGADFYAEINNGNSCNQPSTSITTSVGWIRPMCGFGSFDENEMPHMANILEGNDDEVICLGDVINFPLSADGFCGAEFQWQKDFEDIVGETNANYIVTETGCYRIAIQNTFTGCTVYSKTKKFILLDTVRLNDYSLRGDVTCLSQDTVVGCTQVRLRARIPHCAACDRSISGLSYTWYRDGAMVSQNSYGYITTTDNGTYHVEVSNGDCVIASNEVVVRIQPTEPPTWIEDSGLSICFRQSDSIRLGVTHPAIGDSALVRFDFAYPMQDQSNYEGKVVIDTAGAEAGCVTTILTTRDGCVSRSSGIELHDSIPQLTVRIDGAACAPVRLYANTLSSCKLDSLFWYQEDSLVRAIAYSSYYRALDPGRYSYKVKNACGIFYSDTVTIKGNLSSPEISPEGPVCVPANLSLTFPDPDNSMKVRWYRNPTRGTCSSSASYLIPNEDGLSLTANLPGFYYATIEDTLSGCRSSCSGFVEVQRSVAGASITPFKDIYFCEGTSVTDVNLSVNPSSPSFTYQWYRNSNPIAGATRERYRATEEGVYRVYLENACDDAFTPVVSIFSVDNPDLTINTPDTIYICGPDSIRLSTNSDQPLIYQWYKDDVLIPEATDSIYKAPTPGRYKVYGLNNNTQCEDWSQEVEIILSDFITATMNSSSDCNSDCKGGLEVSVAGGVPFPNGSYRYLWPDGQSTAEANNLCAGSHVVTVTDYVGCNTTFTGVVDTGFSLQIRIDSISCANADDGIIEVQVNGDKTPFQYQWSSGQTDSLINQLTADTYNLTVTDAQSCSKIISVELDNPSPLTIQLQGSNVSCFGSSDGKIEATINGGSTPYQWTWNQAVELDSSNLAAGKYIVTVTDQKSCSIVDSITIDQPQELTANIIVIDQLACTGDSTGQLDVQVIGGAAPYTFQWDDGSSTAPRSNLPAGTFSVSVTDQNNCMADTSYVFSSPLSLNLGIAEQKNISCHQGADGLIRLSANGGAANYQYYLNGDASSDSTFTNLEKGDYEVYFANVNGCISDTLNITLTSPDSLQLEVLTTDVKCHNTPTGTAEVKAAGGTPDYQYQWPTNIDPQQLAAADYQVTVSDKNNCQAIVTVEINTPTPLEIQLDKVDVSCALGTDGKIMANYNGGVEPYTFQWNEVVELDSAMLGAGKYIVTISDANSCQLMDSIIVNEPLPLAANFIILDSLDCQGDSTGQMEVLLTGGTLPYKLQWNNGSFTALQTNLRAGQFTVSVTDNKGCQLITSAELPEAPPLKFSIDAYEDISCFDGADGLISLKAEGGTSPYQYYLNGEASNVSTFFSLPKGEYILQMTDGKGCISEELNKTLTSPDSLKIITSSDPVICYGTSTGTAHAVVSGGVADYTYQWNNGYAESTIQDLPKGEYQLTVTDAHGCEKESWVEVESPDSLVSHNSLFHNDCFDNADGMIVIDSTSGGVAPYQYFFNEQRFPDGKDRVANLSAGFYAMLTIDVNDCEHLGIVEIEEPPLFLVDLGEDLEVKLGEDIQLNAILENGVGEPIFEWTPNDEMECTDASTLSDCATPTILQAKRNGKYEVIVTDENGCTATDEIELRVFDQKGEVFVPTGFTPNQDGNNDILFPFASKGVKTINNFIIFDRWGNHVFESRDFPPNEITFGWDGRVNGQIAASGVYIFVAIYETIAGKQETITGEVTLIW